MTGLAMLLLTERERLRKGPEALMDFMVLAETEDFTVSGGSVAALEMVPDLPADIRSIILKAEIWMIFSMTCLAECLEKHQEAKLPEPMVLAAVPGGAVLTGADLTREILTGAVLARVIFLKAVSAGAGI